MARQKKIDKELISMLVALTEDGNRIYADEEQKKINMEIEINFIVQIADLN